MRPTRYKFAGFELDPREETVSRNGAPLKIKHRAFQVLQLLVENAGKVVAKEEFFETVWRGAFVEENNLTVAVAQIRRALGETAETKFIENVPRKGYRFVAAVERVSGAAERAAENDLGATGPSNPPEVPASSEVKRDDPIERAAPKANPGVFAAFASRKILVLAGLGSIVFMIGAFWRVAAPVPSESLRSVAVLPFSADGDAPDNRILAEKLTRELTSNLGRITAARVSAHNAATAHGATAPDLEGIAADLNVDGLIVGRTRADGETIELAVELNDLRSGKIVWEKRYSFKTSELPEAQYRVARDIARRLGGDGKNSNDFAAANYEAYQAYLAARHHLGKGSTSDCEKAIESFTLAAVKAASFADAHSGLATARILHGVNRYADRGLSAPSESFPAAKRSALRALALNPNSDEALAALAFVSYRYEYDWKNAEGNFKRAVEINPNNVLARRWYGDFLHKTGRSDEGFAVQRDALALDPNSARILNEMAWGAYLAGRFDEAAVYAENARAIDKTSAAALYNQSEIYEHKGDCANAAALWMEAMTIEAASRRWIDNLEESFQRGGCRGFARAKTEWLEDLTEKDYVYPTDLAKGYAALGENGKAVDWLEKGLASRVPDLPSIGRAPAFKNLRGDARFQAVVRQLNFPQ